MTYLGYRIIKQVVFHNNIDSNLSIDLCDYDDICDEVRQLEKQKYIVKIIFLDNSVSFKLTLKGLFVFIWMGIKSIVNYIYAILITTIIVMFFLNAAPSYINLVEAWKSQNSLDVSFYSAQIGFYLTVVVVMISILTLVSSSKSRNDTMLYKLRNEVKVLRKIAEVKIDSISSYSNNVDLIDVLSKINAQLANLNLKYNNEMIPSGINKSSGRKNVKSKK